jgi:hypothetical protein
MLRLTTGTVMMDDQRPADLAGNVRADVLLDHAQRKIDVGRQPGCLT